MRRDDADRVCADKESIEKLKEKLKKFSRDVRRQTDRQTHPLKCVQSRSWLLTRWLCASLCMCVHVCACPLCKADDDALVFAGRYFLHTDKAKQSRQCLEKILAKRPQDVETLVMLGWLNLQSGQSRQARQALAFFEAAIKLTHDRKDIGALLGRAKYYERSAKSEGGASGAGTGAGAGSGSGRNSAAARKKWDRVLDDLNQIIVTYPSFTPALLEKARVLMLMNQWDESLLTAQRVLKKDPRDVSALRIVVLYCLTREGASTNSAANKLNELMEALEANEPRNHGLMYDVSQLVCRLANRKRPLLQQTLVLVERACTMDGSNSAYLTEQGYQLMLLDDFAQASLCFQEASKLDEGNIAPLGGLIKCKIMQGNLREAQQELEFLAEISASIGSNADLTYLHALLAWLKDGNEAKCMEYLNAAMMEHATALSEAALGFGYFVQYNPDFVLEVVQQYMQHVGTEPMSSGDPPNPVLNQCVKLLVELTEMVPGMLGAQLMLSRTNFIAGDFDQSERALATCLKLDPQCAPAHIIQAQICLQRENFQQCSQSLEQARSLDFEIRNTPIYHLMKTKLLEASDQLEDALKVLQAAMELQGVRKSASAGAAAPGGAKGANAASAAAAAALLSMNVHNPSASLKGVVPLQDRISIYLELAAVLAKLGQADHAAKIMADARAEFKHTTESTRVLIADAELACKRRDFDAALKMLSGVPSGDLYAIRAKIKMADIYLSAKKNKKAYAACYQELASSGAQSVHGWMLLGEAYLNIQEPERAIKAYEAALKLNPGDAALSSKIGRALVTTHDYKKAVAYYETAARGGASGAAGDDGPTAISTATRIFLLHDLAELYLSLKDYGNSVRVLQAALEPGQAKKKEGLYDEDVAAMVADVRSLALWADVAQASNDGKVALDTLTAAWTLQVEVLTKIRAETNPDAKKEQKDITSVLCFRLAEYYRSIHQLDKSLQFYNESLKYNESHEKSRLALARLHLLNNDLDACQSQCVTLMRLDPSNKEASLMLADLMFRKNEHEAATFHFQQLLEKNPTRYDALNKLIQLLRRAGRLVDAPRFLKLAEKFNAKATFAAGLHYCKVRSHAHNRKQQQTDGCNEWHTLRRFGSSSAHFFSFSAPSVCVSFLFLFLSFSLSLCCSCLACI